MARPVTKKKLIDEAAIKLFATKGLAATVIKDIAKEAQVTEGALYRHYKSKNDMAWELFSLETETFSKQLSDKIFENEKNPMEKLQEGITFLYSYFDKFPLKFSFILLTQHGFPEENLLDEKYNPYDMVTRFIKEFNSSLSDDLAVLYTAMIMGQVLQPIILYRYKRLKIKPIDCVDTVIISCKAVLSELVNIRGNKL